MKKLLIVDDYKIITDLLDSFIKAVNNNYSASASNYDKLLLNLLPREYVCTSSSVYKRVMTVCSYVSRMSDGYAIRLHRKISGSVL